MLSTGGMPSFQLGYEVRQLNDHGSRGATIRVEGKRWVARPPFSVAWHATRVNPTTDDRRMHQRPGPDTTGSSSQSFSENPTQGLQRHSSPSRSRNRSPEWTHADVFERDRAGGSSVSLGSTRLRSCPQPGGILSVQNSPEGGEKDLLHKACRHIYYLHRARVPRLVSLL